MAIHRVALIFDSVQRPETTGVYCHRALGRLVEVSTSSPASSNAFPATASTFTSISTTVCVITCLRSAAQRVVGHRYAHGLRVVSSKGAGL